MRYDMLHYQEIYLLNYSLSRLSLKILVKARLFRQLQMHLK